MTAQLYFIPPPQEKILLHITSSRNFDFHSVYSNRLRTWWATTVLSLIASAQRPISLRLLLSRQMLRCSLSLLASIPSIWIRMANSSRTKSLTCTRTKTENGAMTYQILISLVTVLIPRNWHPDGHCLESPSTSGIFFHRVLTLMSPPVSYGSICLTYGAHTDLS